MLFVPSLLVWCVIWSGELRGKGTRSAFGSDLTVCVVVWAECRSESGGS